MKSYNIRENSSKDNKHMNLPSLEAGGLWIRAILRQDSLLIELTQTILIRFSAGKHVRKHPC